MPKENKIIPTILNTAIFIIMEIAAFNMLVNNGELQDIWVARVSHKIMANVWGKTESVKYYFSLKKQNELLAQENFQINEELRAYKTAEAIKTNEERMNLDSLKEVDGFKYTHATIVKNSRNKQHNYIIIDKGSADGIGSHAGIISSHGVIGIIDVVGKHYSYALSLMNSEVSVSARLNEEGAVGPLIWDGRSTNGAVLKEIPLQYKFEPGDTVWTSGYSSIFPADIPLGITGESKIVNGATNEIQVTLFQDFSALRYVTVVNNTGLDEISALEESQNKTKEEKQKEAKEAQKK